MRNIVVEPSGKNRLLIRSGKTFINVEDGKSVRAGVYIDYFIQEKRRIKVIHKEIHLEMGKGFVKRESAELMEFVCEVI